MEIVSHNLKKIYVFLRKQKIHEKTIRWKSSLYKNKESHIEEALHYLILEWVAFMLETHLNTKFLLASHSQSIWRFGAVLIKHLDD